MKWTLIILAVLIFFAVNGTFSSLASNKLEEHAAAARKDFCYHMSIGDVAGAIQHIPHSEAFIPMLTHPGKIVECRDMGPALPAAAPQPGACTPMKQALRVKWASDDAVDVTFVYTCLPIINLQFNDLEKAVVTPARD